MKNREQAADKVDNLGEEPSAQHFAFGYLVHDVSRIRRTVMDLIMRPYGITRSQWSVLSALSRGGNNGMMQVDLARLMEVGKVTVGGLVDRLEASGHVERRADASDRRAKRVFITERGFEVIHLMVEVSSDVNRRIFSGLTMQEVEGAEKVLSVVKKNLKEILADKISMGESKISSLSDVKTEMRNGI
ncbi:MULTISPECIES: MarR family winged helix-turn-helix transcriptional regulator [Sphingobium]|uniref:MarR family winged helix-turn-helix transcriptional regulator n=1 Tax=Sphingobium sp. MI1205 TaxID=407020 RepID=UPI0007705D65|nr:MarR family transcriptional regulator [Sphingobium sp. MI1205]AMK19879.1 putative MarR family transcriptional regulator [Sphingobium sp. MI1205]